jgi:putative glutamine amidotransferase
MHRVGVTQRAEIVAGRAECRDALDRRWHEFLAVCGAVAVPLPNHAALATTTARALDVDAILLSGGEDLVTQGGPSHERDEAESALIAWALAVRRPVIGVCRGMQMIATHFGAVLARVEGHVGVAHRITHDGIGDSVNSFHNWAPAALPQGFKLTAQAEDGVIEGFVDPVRRVHAMLWHPERHAPFRDDDVRLFREVLACAR